MANRQLIVECLEARRLMAVDLEAMLPRDSVPPTIWLPSDEQGVDLEELSDDWLVDQSPATIDFVDSSLPWSSASLFGLPFVADLADPNFILTTPTQVIVADNWGYQQSSIWICDRTAENSLANAREIQLDFAVTQQWVVGDRLIVAGNFAEATLDSPDFWWPTEQTTVVVSIDLQKAVELSRVDLSGSLTQAIPVANGLLVQTSLNTTYPIQPRDVENPDDALASISALWHPPESWSELTLLQWTDDGLEKFWNEPMRPGILQASGDRAVFLTYDFSLVDPWEAINFDDSSTLWPAQLSRCEPMVPVGWFPQLKTQLVLKQYHITDAGLETISQTNLDGLPFDTHMQLADDGQHVLVTHAEWQLDPTGQSKGVTHVEWYQLGPETAQLVAQADLSDFYGEVALLGDQRAIAISSMAASEIQFIDLQPNVADDLRVTRVALSQDLQLTTRRMVVMDDHLILAGSTPWKPRFDPPTTDSLTETESSEETQLVDPIVDSPEFVESTDESSAALVILSLADSRVLSETILDGLTAIDKLFTIDSVAGTLGWVGLVTTTDWQWHEQVSFGHIDSSGTLEEIQEVATQNSWAFYSSDVQSLYALSDSRLRVVDWSNPDEVQQLVPLFDPETNLLVANSDTFERSWPTTWQTLDVLSNDTLPRGSWFTTKVITLIDAPSEIYVDESGQVQIPAGFEVSEPLTFQYQLSDGYQESVSTITLEPPSTELLATVEQVRLRAAQDFDSPLDAVTIVSVTDEIGDCTWSLASGDNGTASDCRLIIEVQSPTASARYLVLNDGTIDMQEQYELTSLLTPEETYDQMDINRDGYTTALDVLHVINLLNQAAPLQAMEVNSQDELDGACDLDGDHSITVADAMMIIDRLNSNQSNAIPLKTSTAEGEPSPKLADCVDAVLREWTPDSIQVALPLEFTNPTYQEIGLPSDYLAPNRRRP